ncbi:3752_t:CDS:2, partial [Acaulospora colombiana]
PYKNRLRMSCEELAGVESQQTTSSNKESRENIPSCATSKKSASQAHSSLQGQPFQNEPSSTAESSQELKVNARRQRELNEKVISNSPNACQSISSGRDNVAKSNNTTFNDISGEDVTSGVPNGHAGDNSVNGIPDYDQDENVNSRRQSVNGNNSQRLLDPQSSSNTHQRRNSTSSSSLINITVTNVDTPSSSSSNPASTNTANVNSVGHSYSNSHNLTGSIYEEIPQMYSNQSAQFIPVTSQYFTPFLPNNGQFIYDTQYRFGRSPTHLPPSAQPTFVRSNVYPYSQIPLIAQMHPHPSFHNSLIPTSPLPTRYLSPSSAGGDSGFSSRRSSLDQVRNPEFSPQHAQRIYQQKKPKELDKALWVGNLPESTTHDELKDFFADENMEQTQADLKKSESLSSLVSEHTPPPTPSETGSTASSSTRSRRSSIPPRQRIRQPSVAPMSPASSVSSSKPPSQNRYFILKSLTQDDLDISVQTGLWATQPHNEASLNKAFKNAEHVFLIFSANKSGEFYGYAKMISPISKEMTETVQWTPIDEAALAASSSRPSPASDESKVRTKKSQDEENEDGEDDVVPSRNWGTTFKIEWIKISRDGTEVEPVVGERLIAEFHKTPLQTASSPYMQLMLTQPLNVANQNISDVQDRRTSLPSQNGAPSLQTPIMDPSFMPNTPPSFCYWPQPVLVPQYGATTASHNYVAAQPTWVAPVPKDPSVGINRVQTTQTVGIGSTATMSPMITLDQQQYVESPAPQHHYASAPAQYYSPNSSGAVMSQYPQISPQQYFKNTDDQYQVTPQSQEQSINNDPENDAHIMPY